MQPLNFEANNLFSIGHASLNLEDQGLLLITGYSKDEGDSNGSGKSSISSKGIIWTLYGATSEGLKADKVINRHIEKEHAWGRLTFLTSEGAFLVHRQRRPAKLGLYIAESGQWADISRKTEKDTQLAINSIVGKDFESFIQTDFFGQGRRMNYPSLTPKQQRDTLEQILPIEEIDKWAVEAKKRINETGNELDKIKMKKVRLQNRIETLQAIMDRPGLEAPEPLNIDDVATAYSEWVKADETMKFLHSRQ